MMELLIVNSKMVREPEMPGGDIVAFSVGLMQAGPTSVKRRLKALSPAPDVT